MHTLRSHLRTLKYSRQRPVILHEHGRLALGAAPVTFVVIVGPFFDQTVPNAGTTSRSGWCRGFE
ncbi:MAG: hypothetical protein KGJ80_13015, partial [Chloroflexota bacterium]|nr:hypothetical protein [Chloroflexota bacterium]